MQNAEHGLRAEKIHVWRGDRHVLKGVSLILAPGEIFHVSGQNGTGKTTLLRVLTGLLRPEQGTVFWRGRPIASAAPEYQHSLAYTSHEPALKGDMTALENLRFLVALKRRVHTDELLECLARTGVVACADLPARVLSAGQRRRVALARVLACHAELWLLDEPFTNLDSAGSALVSSLLEEHVRQGRSALVVAHHDLTLGVAVRQFGLAA